MADIESEIGFAQLGLGGILKQNQLAVPPNQREYAWEIKYVRTLFQDFAREIDGDDRWYLRLSPFRETTAFLKLWTANNG